MVDAKKWDTALMRLSWEWGWRGGGGGGGSHSLNGSRLSKRESLLADWPQSVFSPSIVMFFVEVKKYWSVLFEMMGKNTVHCKGIALTFRHPRKKHPFIWEGGGGGTSPRWLWVRGGNTMDRLLGTYCFTNSHTWSSIDNLESSINMNATWEEARVPGEKPQKHKDEQANLPH